MSYDYTRTVSITPVSTSYSWDATPNWITITRVSVNSDDWTITLQENTGNARSATLTVRHANSTTVDTITVNQAEGAGVPDPTATPVPTSVPTATPVPTSVPTATPVPTAQPTPNPTQSQLLNQHLVQTQRLHLQLIQRLVIDLYLHLAVLLLMYHIQS